MFIEDNHLFFNISMNQTKTERKKIARFFKIIKYPIGIKYLFISKMFFYFLKFISSHVNKCKEKDTKMFKLWIEIEISQ